MAIKISAKRRRGFALNTTLAREAGRKGGRWQTPDMRTFSRDRNLAREAGRKGGIKRQEQKRLQKLQELNNDTHPDFPDIGVTRRTE